MRCPSRINMVTCYFSPIHSLCVEPAVSLATVFEKLGTCPYAACNLYPFTAKWTEIFHRSVVWTGLKPAAFSTAVNHSNHSAIASLFLFLCTHRKFPVMGIPVSTVFSPSIQASQLLTILVLKCDHVQFTLATYKRGYPHNIFLIFPWKHNMLWYPLEAPLWGASNEYPQHMFLWRN